jgi:hypothetical protein
MVGVTKSEKKLFFCIDQSVKIVDLTTKKTSVGVPTTTMGMGGGMTLLDATTILACGGCIKSVCDNCEKYSNGAWTPAPKIPANGVVVDFAMCTLNEEAYVFGGWDSYTG